MHIGHIARIAAINVAHICSLGARLHGNGRRGLLGWGFANNGGLWGQLAGIH